ncbi:phosphodiesterase [Pseudooceanicola sp. CBS1P-1]|uniref:Phosphodiesterase n=1 Tax=Pseudooceanicola albus TaxID=2692189 RepID=A0A6L7GAH6_9RHOB|nr:MULTISPECIES: glycerophosphodiester phosphodiesterase family protein [Pseudooceanicola]MBT9384128.1 phosphodiesterase [Pseudooceanicola endophyticus]MXN19773.1 phosphodiesterase [Pseudooceanicola albus]
MTRPPLPPVFRTAPIAHRALHDRDAGRPENSPEAVAAAIAAGYGIEIDLQLTSDGEAVVFHDDTLERLTGQSGPVGARSLAQLQQIPLTGGATGIPSFAQILAQVAGRAPLLVEIKDQSAGAGIGPLEAAAARAVAGYEGPLAFMSFNPDAVAEIARLCPTLPRGLTTWSWEGPECAGMDPAHLAHLRAIADFDRTGASFISHEAADLSRPQVAALKAAGVPVLCWTIRSAQAEAEARRLADNVTFEGYPAALPA